MSRTAKRAREEESTVSAFVSKSISRKKFTIEEDDQLRNLINNYFQANPSAPDEINWDEIANNMERRNGRQCRDRWFAYLSPDGNHGPFSRKEDEIIMHNFSIYGPRWDYIASLLDKRTGNQVKNRYSSIRRRLDLQEKEYSSYSPISADGSPESYSMPEQKPPPKVAVKSTKKSIEVKQIEQSEDKIDAIFSNFEQTEYDIFGEFTWQL